jgi:hypothetical protein
MPYKSTAQRAFMNIHHPEIAKKWNKMPTGPIPEHVQDGGSTMKTASLSSLYMSKYALDFSPKAGRGLGLIGGISGGLHGLLFPGEDDRLSAAAKQALLAAILAGGIGGTAVGTAREKLLEALKKSKKKDYEEGLGFLSNFFGGDKK